MINDKEANPAASAKRASGESAPSLNTNCGVGEITRDLTPFTKVEGIRVYGEVLVRTPEQLASTLARLQPNPEAELHLLRHFSEVSAVYRATLVGTRFERKNWQTNAMEMVVINDQMIDQALATKGSKFFPGVAHSENPGELIGFVRDQALLRAKAQTLPVFDGKFCEKMLFSIPKGTVVGKDGVVPVDTAEKLERQPRGKLDGDDFLVNVAPGHPGISSQQISVVIGIIGEVPHVFTAYPGALAPDFPRDGQVSDEKDYNKGFWNNHAFVG